ncbi:MAG: hypothetical protein RLZZ58_60, partial [Pseudomonadota bacterium]
MHILSIATLFPDDSRPNFGLFVERSLREAAAQPGVRLSIVAPVGVPPWPLSLHPRYRARAALPVMQQWNGLTVHRPRFPLIPRFGARFNPAMVARAVLPIARRLHAETPIDGIDAQFFFPDGPAAMHVAAALTLPFIAKARGADISHWADDPMGAPRVAAAASAAARMLAVSEAMKADMVAAGFDGSKIQVHYTGIDRDRFCPGDRRAARAWLAARLGRDIGDAPLIATVGALIARKGQRLVIDALAGLPGVQYALAGSGEDEAMLRMCAGDAGTGDRVHFLGSVGNADLPMLYRAADAVVMPSASEGLANAWVEAIACGTPVVISDAGGARELVQSEAAGRVVARDPRAIAVAVRDVIAAGADPDAVAATLGDRFSWDRNGRELAAH